MSGYDFIRERLNQDRVVILDGAIGTEILRRDVSWHDHQVIYYPDVIRSIHEDYIKAGADVVTTNTFQLSRRSLSNHFRDLKHMRQIGARDLEERAPKLLRAAVELVREARSRAAGDRPVAIAGSVTTLEWCFRPDLSPSGDEARRDYREIFETMAESGADLILLETMNGVAEAGVAVEEVKKGGLPVWVSFVSDDHGRLLSGESIHEAVRALEPLDPDAILLNCAPAGDITKGLRELAGSGFRPVGVYPHIGRFDPPEWDFTLAEPPETYRDLARRWVEMGARIIGGCCGTTPEHIRLIAEALK